MTTEQHGEAREQVGAVIGSYWDLLAVMRLQVATNMNISYDTLDQLAGYTDAFASKLLSDTPQRPFTPKSFSDYLNALCLDLVAYHNPAKLQKLKKTQHNVFKKREQAAAMLNGGEHPPIILRFSRRRMKKLAKLAAEGRKRIPERKRIEIARRAAWVRWERLRLLEVAKGQVSAAGFSFCRWTPAIARAMLVGRQMGLFQHLRTKPEPVGATPVRSSQPRQS